MTEKSDTSSKVPPDVQQALKEQIKRQIIKEQMLKLKQGRLLTKASSKTQISDRAASSTTTSTQPPAGTKKFERLSKRIEEAESQLTPDQIEEIRNVGF